MAAQLFAHHIGGFRRQHFHAQRRFDRAQIQFGVPALDKEAGQGLFRIGDRIGEGGGDGDLFRTKAFLPAIPG